MLVTGRLKWLINRIVTTTPYHCSYLPATEDGWEVPVSRPSVIVGQVTGWSMVKVANCSLLAGQSIPISITATGLWVIITADFAIE